MPGYSVAYACTPSNDSLSNVDFLNHFDKSYAFPLTPQKGVLINLRMCRLRFDAVCTRNDCYRSRRQPFVAAGMSMLANALLGRDRLQR